MVQSDGATDTVLNDGNTKWWKYFEWWWCQIMGISSDVGAVSWWVDIVMGLRRWCWMMAVLSDAESTLSDVDIITFKPWQTCPVCIQGSKISVAPFVNFLCSTTVLPLMNVTSAVGRSFFKSVLYCTARTLASGPRSIPTAWRNSSLFLQSLDLSVWLV